MWSEKEIMSSFIDKSIYGKEKKDELGSLN